MWPRLASNYCIVNSSLEPRSSCLYFLEGATLPRVELSFLILKICWFFFSSHSPLPVSSPLSSTTPASFFSRFHLLSCSLSTFVLVAPPTPACLCCPCHSALPEFSPSPRLAAAHSSSQSGPADIVK